MNAIRPTLLSLAAAALAALAVPAAAQTLRTVALKGQPAPGTSSGVNYITFDSPRLNAAGQAAFFGVLTGSGVTSANINGVWSERSGSLALVARKGDPAPGTSSGVNFSNLNSPLLDGAGQTAFSCLLTGSGVTFANDGGIWSEGSGALTLVAREGNPASGTSSGVNYSELFTPVLNSGGQTAFLTTLTGSGVTTANDRGIWSEGSGSLALVAREGDPAPGTSSGVNYNVINAPVLNGAGQTAFLANLTGSGVTPANVVGIWSEGSGSLALVARASDAAPGTPGGVNYSGFFSPVLNGAGQTAFVAFLTGSGVTSANNSGIWSEGSGSLTLVARMGDPAPGTPSGVNYSNFTSPNTPLLNGAGQTAFLADLAGSGVTTTNDRGIWSEGSGALALVAREGAAAPGTPSGVTYSSFFDSLTLNGAG